jgi:hypothetical protein
MEAARTSETLINFYQTTRRYNPEDSHLRTHRRENLKSYEVYVNVINPAVLMVLYCRCKKVCGLHCTYYLASSRWGEVKKFI